jgi:hypothetical protein
MTENQVETVGYLMSISYKPPICMQRPQGNRSGILHFFPGINGDRIVKQNQQGK